MREREEFTGNQEPSQMPLSGMSGNAGRKAM
jgi:hypothetical protein